MIPLRLRAIPNDVPPIGTPPHDLHRRVDDDSGAVHLVHEPGQGQGQKRKSALSPPSSGEQGAIRKKKAGFRNDVDVGRYPNLPEWKEGDDERDKAAQAAGTPPSSPVETDEDRKMDEKERKQNKEWSKLRDNRSTATHRPPRKSSDDKWEKASHTKIVDPEELKEENKQIVDPVGDPKVPPGAPLDTELRGKMHPSQSTNTVLRTEWNKDVVRPEKGKGIEEIHDERLQPHPSTQHATIGSDVAPIRPPRTVAKKGPALKLALNPKPSGPGLH
jgi:hypothetical protein